MSKSNKFLLLLQEKLTRPRTLKISWIAVVLILALILVSEMTGALISINKINFPQVAMTPITYSSHLTYAWELINQRNLKEAIYEKGLAEELASSQKTQVLGAQSQLDKLELELSNVQQKYSGNLSFWKNLLNTFPDYQSASINLAIIYYNQGKITEAKGYLTNLLFRYPDLLFDIPAQLRDLL